MRGSVAVSAHTTCGHRRPISRPPCGLPACPTHPTPTVSHFCSYNRCPRPQMLLFVPGCPVNDACGLTTLHTLKGPLMASGASSDPTGPRPARSGPAADAELPPPGPTADLPALQAPSQDTLPNHTARATAWCPFRSSPFRPLKPRGAPTESGHGGHTVGVVVRTGNEVCHARAGLAQRLERLEHWPSPVRRVTLSLKTPRPAAVSPAAPLHHLPSPSFPPSHSTRCHPSHSASLGAGKLVLSRRWQK